MDKGSLDRDPIFPQRNASTKSSSQSGHSSLKCFIFTPCLDIDFCLLFCRDADATRIDIFTGKLFSLSLYKELTWEGGTRVNKAENYAYCTNSC